MPAIGNAIEPRSDRLRDIRGEMHGHARRFDLGTLGLCGAVEKQLDLACRRHQRDAVAFENAEVGAVAQVIALPGIAVKHHLRDAGLAHGRH